MNMLRLYSRVLKLLGPQLRLGWLLALGNVTLAIAQFAEPVLFGRIIDHLAGAQSGSRALSWPDLTTLVTAWVGFGLFIIVCGALVALFADRLAHQRRQAVLTAFFEHVLQLPLSFHGGIHSGRLMKVMLSGTDALWDLWLGFFREHLAALVAIFVLLPMSLYLNWRLGRAAPNRDVAADRRALLFGPRRASLGCARERGACPKLHAGRGRSDQLAPDRGPAARRAIAGPELVGRRLNPDCGSGR